MSCWSSSLGHREYCIFLSWSSFTACCRTLGDEARSKHAKSGTGFEKYTISKGDQDVADTTVVQIHNLLPLREGSHLSSIPWRARPPSVSIRRGTLYRLQAVRGHLPRASHHDRGRGASGRFAQDDTLRHRHDQVHLLWLLPGVLSRGCHCRKSKCRVLYGD